MLLALLFIIPLASVMVQGNPQEDVDVGEYTYGGTEDDGESADLAFEPEGDEEREEADDLERSTRASDWRQVALNLHNKYRARHGAKKLKLSSNLNKSAQKCADYMVKFNKWGHVCEAKFGFKGGENLAQRFEGSASDVAASASNAWYNEHKHYNYKNGGFGSTTGHFTQLVWKGTKRVGFGYAKKGNNRIFVGHYDPSGNYKGKFRQNVGSPKGK